MAPSRISPELISVRCMSCLNTLPVEKAIAAGWQLCEGCDLVMCSTCIEMFRREGIKRCPSEHKGIAPHFFSFSVIPIERIIVFASLLSEELREDSIIYRLFYKDRVPGMQLFKEKEKESEREYLEWPTKVQEERWRNMRTVITCRRKDGKFVSWETLSVE